MRNGGDAGLPCKAAVPREGDAAEDAALRALTKFIFHKSPQQGTNVQADLALCAFRGNRLRSSVWNTINTSIC